MENCHQERRRTTGYCTGKPHRVKRSHAFRGLFLSSLLFANYSAAISLLPMLRYAPASWAPEQPDTQKRESALQTILLQVRSYFRNPEAWLKEHDIDLYPEAYRPRMEAGERWGNIMLSDDVKPKHIRLTMMRDYFRKRTDVLLPFVELNIRLKDAAYDLNIRRKEYALPSVVSAIMLRNIYGYQYQTAAAMAALGFLDDSATQAQELEEELHPHDGYGHEWHVAQELQENRSAIFNAYIRIVEGEAPDWARLRKKIEKPTEE